MNFIDNDGIELCLETRGNGSQHLLFLHGWISARRMWYEVCNRLDPSRFTIHMLDFRGCGLSDRPAQGHHLYGYLSDVVAACAHIAAPVCVVAHSMGGRVAQLAACEYPQLFRSLILIAPGSPGGTKVGTRRAALARKAFGSRRDIEAFQRAAMAVNVHASVMERLVDDALLAQREVWFGDGLARQPVDFGHRLAGIRARVLCLTGAKDPLAPPARVKADVVARIPGALAVTLRSCGHNIPVEAPQDVASAIERFAHAGDETRST